MPTAQTSIPRGEEPIRSEYPHGAGVFLSSSDFDALMEELQSLRVTTSAALGSVVRVADRAGRTSELQLVGRLAPEDVREKVTLASPTGEALLGAKPGDYVRITLPNGRQRRVRVVDVTSDGSNANP